MKLLGIEFAPLSVPFQRRIQTLSVFFWISSFLFVGPAVTCLLVYLLLYTRFWWLSVLYLTWMVYDNDTCNRGGRSGWSVRFVRGWTVWKYYAKFFPIKLVKTSELPADRNYLLGSHPHGVLCSGVFGCFGTEGVNFSQEFPGLIAHLLALEGQFKFPGYREMFASSGACASTKRSMEFIFSQPASSLSVLVVGGASESLNNAEKEIHLILTKRKGFIKLALRHGVSLVPSFSFGEAFIYDQVPNPEGSWVRWMQEILKKQTGFAPVLFLGRGIFQYGFGLLPNRKPITVVVGNPIHVHKIQDPDMASIERLHAQYSAALVELYNKYNPIYGDSSVKLIIT